MIQDHSGYETMEMKTALHLDCLKFNMYTLESTARRMSIQTSVV